MLRHSYRTNKGFDIRLEAKLKNATLVRAREKLELKPREVSEKIGIGYGYYLNIERMQVYPSQELQQKICGFYRAHGIFMLEEDVFPNELKQNKPMKRYIQEREIPRSQLISLSQVSQRYLPTVDNQIEEKEFEKEVRNVLSTLKKREEEIIILRFGLDDGIPYTLKEIGEQLNLSIKRVQEIQAGALRKLRHSERADRLKLAITKTYL